MVEVSVGTVKSRILRGRRMLREILDPVLRSAKAQASQTASRQSAPSRLQAREKAEPPTPETIRVSNEGAASFTEVHGVEA